MVESNSPQIDDGLDGLIRDDVLYKLSEAAALVGVTPAWFRFAFRAGTGPHLFIVGTKSYRILGKELKRHLRNAKPKKFDRPYKRRKKVRKPSTKQRRVR